MIEGGGSGLLPEAGLVFLVLQPVSGEKLQRHDALEFRVLGLVDHAHAALAELLEDFVVGDGLTDHGLALVP